MLNKWPLRLISVLSIGGGFTGLTLLLPFFLQVSGVISLLLNVLVAAFYCFGLYTGYRLLEDNTKIAVNENLKYWALQVPALGTPVFLYEISSGAMLSVAYISDAGFNVSYNLGSSFSYGLLDPERPNIIGINFIAVVVVIYLAWILRQRSASD